jgi:hypothetical protein
MYIAYSQIAELKGEPSWSSLAMCQVVRSRGRSMEKTPDDQVNEVLEPAEQQTILFCQEPHAWKGRGLENGYSNVSP